MVTYKTIRLFIAAVCCCSPLALAYGEQPLQFNRDIRSILSDRCFQCHGPDESHRESGLRLDERASALQASDSGEVAIVPNDAEASELIRRILSDDPDEIMPPSELNKPLTPAEKELLRRWVNEGAKYQRHWAFTPPHRTSTPEVQNLSWPRNSIDNFVLARLESAGLEPSPPTDWTTLFRRLSLDLTGLPPQSNDVAAFLQDVSTAESQVDKDRVYANWVDKFLASAHYGERMAVDWLDAARFADTNGYQVDRDREMYAWRDWVINAFNSNQPFDQFTLEQFAGDLLPEPTLEQKIATGFHRNHMLNEEGGIIPEEFLAEYCADRVETTATVWLGQTFNCCRCHDHKFDPFTQKDFYSLYAFFHNVAEKGVGDYGANIRRNAPPMLKLPTPELEAIILSLQQELKQAEVELATTKDNITTEQLEWEKRLQTAKVDWLPVEFQTAKVDITEMTIDESHIKTAVPAMLPGTHTIEVVLTLPKSAATSLKIECIADNKHTEQPIAFEVEDLIVSVVDENSTPEKPLQLWPAEIENSLAAEEVFKAFDDNSKTEIDVSINAAAPTVMVATLDQPITVSSTKLRLKLVIVNHRKIYPWNLRVFTTPAKADLLVPTNIQKLVRIASQQRSEVETKKLSEFFQKNHPKSRQLKKQIAKMKNQIDETDLQIPTTLVMEEIPSPRKTFVLVRGAYSNKGEEVTAASPAVLPSMPEDLPRNRLGLAQWLINPENPLPARVTVNRFWQSLFGTGLVQTAEDFGTQGEAPSHPELLDWLAVEFVESGWDIKAMLRLLVTSSSYRQSSRLTPALLDLDPKNRLLSRGPRFRLQAEFVRDQALAASGLLVTKIGGPSVRPYHPPGLYEQVVAGSSANTYVLGQGDELYRRSLYTYWKRSVPNPAMLVFDAPFREICAMRRSRTNTPLQALNLMNDPTYVEAARVLAERMIREGGETTAAQIDRGFQLLLGRAANPQESTILYESYQRMVKEFSEDKNSAAELIKVGETPADAELDAVQVAAMTTVASTLLNLDETVNKE